MGWLKLRKQMQEIVIKVKGPGSTIRFNKTPSLMDLAISVNVLMSVMHHNFDTEDVEQAIDAAWHKIANVEEVYK